LTYDIDELVQRDLGPALINSVYNYTMEPVYGLFGKEAPENGAVITRVLKPSNSSNNAAYDKSSVDVAAGTHTLVKATWTKKFYNGAAEAYNIDASNNVRGDIAVDALAENISDELKSIGQTQFDAFAARLLADIDSSATAYSDASLSRSTYSSLASYEEVTDATITMAYFRTMVSSTLATKVADKRDYVCLMEETVYNAFHLLAAAENASKPTEGGTLAGAAYGYSPTAFVDGIPIVVLPGMTTGSVYFVRRQDVHIVENMPMRMEVKPVARDTKEVQIYHGITPFVTRPDLQGKMLNKD
jgi:hypothetical protein